MLIQAYDCIKLNKKPEIISSFFKIELNLLTAIANYISQKFTKSKIYIPYG